MREQLDDLTALERGEVTVTTGLRYGTDEPVRVRVRKRVQRYELDDDGAAVRLAGSPDGWHVIADGLAHAHGLNINRDGVVFVPTTRGQDLPGLVLSVADTSLSLYAALQDTDFEVGFDSDTSVE